MELDNFPATIYHSKEAFSFYFSTIFTGWVPTLLRTGRGMTLCYRPSVVPAEKLELSHMRTIL
jgi:hypothetical protein